MTPGTYNEVPARVLALIERQPGLDRRTIVQALTSYSAVRVNGAIAHPKRAGKIRREGEAMRGRYYATEAA